MILGLMESQRGRDAAAVADLRQAEEVRPDDPLASYYLGQALVLVGQPDAAAEAFERAIARKPARTDLLEVYQALGRVHQRAHHNDRALAVWTRLEKQFPDDLRVQEQIAAALAEESDPAQALPRYEVLAKKSTDAYRKIQFRMDAADLKVRLGQQAEALKDFESLLGQLNPDGWLHREVRRRIEDVFLRNDDQAGLASYYEKWVEKNPEDVDAMARLGRTLALQGRAGEARRWFEKAVQLAPSRRELRLALIEQLVLDKKIAEAAAQYEAMAKADPGNPDTLRDWGRILLRDETKPEADRKKAAAAVWNKLIEARPKDAATAVQVADLLRQAEMSEEVIALYNKAIALAPDSAQYREYLGQFYHELKRPDEALATWSQIAAGKNRNAKNLGRLAEVLEGFGFKKEALAAAADACALDKDTFDLQIQYADLLCAAERYDDALRQLEVADKAADDPEQHEAVLDRQIKVYQEAKTLPVQIAALQKALDAGERSTPERWRRLARYLEAERRLPEARTAIEKALELGPKSVPSWVVAARIFEQTGNLGAAAEAYRKLADIDRRARSEHLTNVAKLEARLGRRDEAMRAGRDLLAASPGNPEAFQFFADLCFQLGQTDEGLDVLRRAVRLNETDPKAILTLAETLASQFRTEEAIEMFWRGFDKSPDLESRLGIVARLTNLYMQQSQFDRLIARLERGGREADRQREMTLCRATAYSTSGDYGTARQELERLLTANTRDTQLLTQLAALAETEGDWETAAKYQKQLYEIAPNDENAAKLAQLYLRAGEIAEAEALWSKMAGGESDEFRVLQASDSLLAHHKEGEVLAIADRLLRQRPDDWEALYRAGVALACQDQPAEATRRFQSLLALKLADETESLIVKARKKNAGKSGATPAPARPNAIRAVPLQLRMTQLQQIRSAVGLESRYSFGTASAWSPGDFGQARIAALGWLYAMAQKDGKPEELVNRLRAARDQSPRDPRPFWDFYYLQLVRMDHPGIFEASRALAKVAPNDPEAQWAFLSSLPARAQVQQRGGVVTYTPGVTNQDKTPPLQADELEDVLASFAALRRRRPEWVLAPILTAVADELARSKRKDQEDQFYRDAVAAATDADAVANVMSLAAERGDVDELLAQFDRYLRLLGNRPLSQYTGIYTSFGTFAVPPAPPPVSFGRAMGVRADAKAHADILKLFDRYLAAIRQPDQVALRKRSRLASPTIVSRQFQIWSGKQTRWVNIDYPSPNTYYDLDAIQLLRTAFELYKRDDLVSNLLAHFTKLPESASETDRVYAELAQGYLHWWAEEKDEALQSLTRAAALSKSDPELLLDLAELRAQRNEPEEALAVADSFEPLDQKTTQRREILALRLAVLTGDIDRARRAAERLFNLRLDADTQVQLAAQMHQLGMHELAEAVLGRARRRVGNNVAVLVNLMNQYQRQNKPEIAVQVAYQILPRNSSRRNNPNFYYNESDQAQREAIGVLARSGKLKDLIARAAAQLERSPNSVQLHQALADYYQAAGEKDKVKAEYETIAKIRPDDARLRFQVARHLQQLGDKAAAIEHYKAALKKEPSLLGDGYWEIEQLFKQANKIDELLALLDEVDMHQLGQPWSIGNIISRALRESKQKEVGKKLLIKAWKAFPNGRGNLLAYVYGSEGLTEMPEMYDLAREVALPAADQTRVAPWSGIDQIILWIGEGKVLGYGNFLLEVATRQAKLGALAEELKKDVARRPEWRGGQVLLALVEARRGRVEQAKPTFQALLVDDKDNRPPAAASLIIGPELEQYGLLQEIALRLYEDVVKEPSNEDLIDEFNYSPARRLVALDKRLGRNEAARQQILQYLRKGDSDRYSFDVRYAAYQKIQQRTQIGAMLVELGFPADAARLYAELLADGETLKLAREMGWGGNQVEQIRGAINRVIEGLDRDTLGPTLKSLIRSDGQKADGPAVDLVLLVHPHDLEHAALTSLFAASLQAAADTPALFDEVRGRLEKLAEENRNDLSVQIAAALAALMTGKAAALAPALARLEKLVAETPLEELPANARANARQRAEASPQMALWLVARACAKQKGCEEIGARLADRALEAARRQSDPFWSLAMLRESAQAALDTGDRALAEARYARMLDVILINPLGAEGRGNRARRRDGGLQEEGRRAEGTERPGDNTRPLRGSDAAGQARRQARDDGSLAPRRARDAPGWPASRANHRESRTSRHHRQQ